MRDEQKRARGKRRRFPVIMLCAALFLGVCAGAVWVYLFMPNWKQVSPYDMNIGIKKDQVNIVFNDALIDAPAAPFENKNGVVYIPADFIKQYVDPYIFWDDKEQWLTVTAAGSVKQFRAGDASYLDNGGHTPLDAPVLAEDGRAYLPQDLAQKLYPMTMRLDKTYNMLIIDSTDKDRQTAPLLKKGEARYAADIKSPVAEKLNAGDAVAVLGREKDFTRVRLNDGLFGYVKTDLLGAAQTAAATGRPPNQTSPPLPRSTAINMLWDQVFLPKDNAAGWRKTIPPGVNVVSPTWFLFDHDKMDGSIISIADKDYADNAHAAGCKVWPLIADETSDIAHALLSSTAARQQIIAQIMGFISAYDLDGLNIDFEKVQPADALYYQQFLRELKPLMSAEGAVLSVDLYVPQFTQYYGRADIAKTVDYACVMAYDEHTLSDGAGPVGSIGFVDKGVSDTLQDIPRQKVILGIPFYERLWREEPGADPELSLSNMSMTAAAKLLKDNNAQLTWDPELGYNYAAFSDKENGDGVNYRIWLEDAESIGLKIGVASKYALAGTAAWKFGLETDDIWPVVEGFEFQP